MKRTTFGAPIYTKLKKYQIKPADVIEILVLIVQIPGEEQRKEKKKTIVLITCQYHSNLIIFRVNLKVA